jgi:predicted PurR-regulated permease PerM
LNITKRRLRIAILILIGLSILYFLWLVRGSLYPFLIAFAIAYVLNPAVLVLTRRGTPRIPAIIIVYATLGSIVGIFVVFLAPILIRELSDFTATVPEFTRRMQILIEEIRIRYDSAVLPDVLRPIIDESIAEIQIGLQQFVRDIFDALLSLVTHALGLLIAPILAFYILNEWKEIGQTIREFIPIAWRREFLLMMEEIDTVLSGVIRGQLTVGLLVMVLVSIGLYFLGLEFAILIGIFAGLLDVVPYFGAVVGAVPAITLAVLQSPGMVLKVILLFLLVHQLEGSILAPKILGDNVGLHPLTVIFALLVGGELYGFLGLLLAVPIAAILKVIAKHAIGWVREH